MANFDLYFPTEVKLEGEGNEGSRPAACAAENELPRRGPTRATSQNSQGSLLPG